METTDAGDHDFIDEVVVATTWNIYMSKLAIPGATRKLRWWKNHDGEFTWQYLLISVRVQGLYKNHADYYSWINQKDFSAQEEFFGSSTTTWHAYR
jgi:hypothetical protein